MDYIISIIPKQTASVKTDFHMSTSLKILLVEDNESNQVLMMRLLGRFGYSAALAKNGVEAVEKLKMGQRKGGVRFSGFSVTPPME